LCLFFGYFAADVTFRVLLPLPNIVALIKEHAQSIGYLLYMRCRGEVIVLDVSHQTKRLLSYVCG